MYCYISCKKCIFKKVAMLQCQEMVDTATQLHFVETIQHLDGRPMLYYHPLSDIMANSLIFGHLQWRQPLNSVDLPCWCWTMLLLYMMTSSNGNIFRVTSHLFGEFTGPRWILHTKASDAELWCFLWSASEPTVEKTIMRLVIWDAIVLIMTSL